MSRAKVDDEQVQFALTCLKQEMEQIRLAIAELQSIMAASARVLAAASGGTVTEGSDPPSFVANKR